VRPLLLAVMLFAPATAWTQAPALDGTWVGTWQTRAGQTGQLVLQLTQVGERVSGIYDADKAPSGTVRGVRVQGTFDEDQTLSGTFFGRKAIKSFSVTRTERGR